VERDLLTSAVQNLLQNAFKFTKTKSTVMLRAYAVADRVKIDVEDRCGGLPPEFAGIMFLPFTQAGTDKSGVGLGLAISRRGVMANKGFLNVDDLPGVGCIFSIDLPRHEWRSGTAATTPLR
jgi:signal transduction histidine kinase